MCVDVSVWVSCQIDDYAICSHLDHVADGGHKSPETGFKFNVK